ncbi:hypothetical protein J3R83DRAFT_493 [Lanmaoa asiatica]|nr:hypothetical protein J3R83DRAFT_493 [Lanmaoa asiatica]
MFAEFELESQLGYKHAQISFQTPTIMSQYGEAAAPPVDPYSDAYNAPAPAASESRDRDAPRARSRSRSPARSNNGYRSPPNRRKSPPPKRPSHAPIAPNPSAVLGVFGLSIRTQERDLDEEFSRFGRVEKVTIVYDQRSDRSRGFGFIKMSGVEEATRCIQELNGIVSHVCRNSMDAASEWTIRSPTVPMHPPQGNIWDIVVLTGTRIQAVNIVTRTATHIVTGTVTTVVMIVTGTETPMVVITVTGVTVVVRLLAVDVTHLITGDVGVTQEARREVAALARITMALLMVPLLPPTMLKMAVVGEVITCALNMSCSVFICLFLAKGRACTNEGFMADKPPTDFKFSNFLVTSCLEEASTWFGI